MSEKSLKVNSILNIIKTLSSILFPLITFPYISRVLQPENVGRVNFGVSFVSYFSLIASLGINTYAIRECSSARNEKKKLEKLASEIFSINICTTIIAYVFLIITLVLFRKLDNYRILIIIQSTTIFFTTWGADWLNSAMEDFKYITLRSIAFQFISLALMFLFVKEPKDYLKYAAITVISSSGSNLTNVFYRKKYCSIHFTSQMSLKIHLKPIILLFVMILAQNIFNNADITMLGLMKGDFAVGIYSTAYKIKNIIVQVTSSLLWVVMPRMSLYFNEGNYSKINTMLKKVLGLMVFIGFPCIAGCIALSSEIVQMIGGSQYTSAKIPLIILMLSFFVDIFGGSFLGNMVCLPGKNEKEFMKACCFAAAVNIILNYILIPYGGPTSAAFTSGISACIIFIWLFLKKDKKIEMNYVFEVCKAPLVGSLILIIYCFIIKQFVFGVFLRIIICILGSIFLYGGVNVIMKNNVTTILIDFVKK